MGAAMITQEESSDSTQCVLFEGGGPATRLAVCFLQAEFLVVEVGQDICLQG